MSADNWTECPSCDSRKADREIALSKQLRDKYGMVDEEVYLRLKREYESYVAQELGTNLREDYEFNIDIASNELNIIYSCRCEADDCDFSFSYHDTVALKI